MSPQIWISELAREKILEERYQHFPIETGGILFGYRKIDEGIEHWVVTCVVGPGPSAKHFKYRFTPDHDYHQEAAIEHFELNGGREYYLGDWHTHPNASAQCSWIDRGTIYKNARRANHTNYKSIMLIVGGEINSPSYRVYIGEKTNWCITKIKIPLYSIPKFF